MKTIAWDCETFLIERARPFPPVVCLAWYDGENSGVIPHGDALRDFAARTLADPEINLVGHNIAYDHGVLAASWPELLPAIFEAYRAGRVTDTQIRQQLFDIATGHTLAEDGLRTYSLERLYETIFNRRLPGPPKAGPDAWRLRYGELYDVEFVDWPEAAVEYPRHDAINTWGIWNEQNKVANLLRDDAQQSYAAFVLSLTTAQGLRTDAETVARFEAEQRDVMAAIEPELIQAGLLEPKYKGRGATKAQIGYTKKTRPAQERIAKSCAELGVEPMLTDSGIKLKREGGVPGLQHFSIDRTACYYARDDLMLRRAEYVTAEKMISTYLPSLQAGVDGPVTSRFNLAATGRTTSSAPREPLLGMNQQNAPRKTKRALPARAVEGSLDTALTFGAGVALEDSPIGVRECFRARPGKIYLSGDFQGAELHGVAQVCKWKFGYSTLGDALNAGRDVHLVLATQLLGRPESAYDDVVASYKQHDPETVKARQNSKPGNFGFWGAMGVKTFIKTQLREGVYWSMEDATRLRKAWLAAWREAQEYFDAGKMELGPEGKAVVEFYYSKRLRKVRGLSTICNGFFQALVADGSKKSISETIRRCYVGGPESPLFVNNTRPVNFIHDELVTETDDHTDDVDRMQPVVREFADTMAGEFNELVPDYPTGVDAVLSYVQSKRAEPVFDSAGRLIPWTL